ncbi:MAG: DNA repair protein RecN [Bacteroidetes bacterium]|nr:DNA repair protein RecN [Bacteroidota bacterium]
MLQQLTIDNYAIIDHLKLQPDAQLNIVTGETGAGKSIILGALSLILGERADTNVLINKEQKCVVEANFKVTAYTALKEALLAADLDEEDTCIIRREISANGKSRAFVNDTPVNLTILNQITALLIDLHQQFDHLALSGDSFQLNALDAIAGATSIRSEYQQAYNRHKKQETALSDLLKKQAEWQKESDYKQFLLDELTNGAFKENEVEDAAAQLKSLTHAERIGTVLSQAEAILQEGEQPILNELKKILQQLQSIEEWLPQSVALNERLNSALEELKDISSEISELKSTVVLDEFLINSLQERVDLGYRLLKKHGLPDTNSLLKLQQELQQELQLSMDLGEKIAQIQQENTAQYQIVTKLGNELSAKRIAAAPAFAKNVNELLALVGMPNAKFEISIQKLTQPTLLGLDLLSFELDANKSGRFLPLHKAASGGEMSRIMLCIKSLTAKAMQLPTLIFDEVDTGISGEAAKQVGHLLRELANYHQVICITHQPQVAARATNHLFVFKEEQPEGKITTNVRTLDDTQHVEAIAKMIGGALPGQAALANARELIASTN